MILMAAWVIGWQRPPAEEVLREVLSHYQKLKSFSAKIIHHADFMTDVKNSTDTLAWMAPKRFELANDHISIPKLICDGKKLTTFIPNISPIGENFSIERGRTSPWEARGGILLSCLMHGEMLDEILHPEKPAKASFEHGKVIHWHDQSVSLIIETISVRGVSQQIYFYLSANYQKLIGTEITNGTETSSTEYDDQIENPPLPKTLGTVVPDGGE